MLPLSGTDARRRRTTKNLADPSVRPDIGPFATAVWSDGRWSVSRTPEGRDLVSEYLAAHPNPWRLLKSCHPSTVAVALAAGMDMGDVNSECVCGVYRAAETFDPVNASQFSTYSVLWMRAAVGKAAARWIRTGGGCRTGTSLDGEASQLDLVSSDLRRLTNDEDPAQAARVATLRSALAKVDLPPRARAILAHRFGLDGAKVLTLDALATRFGVVRERIRQIQSWATRKLWMELGREPVDD